MIYRLTIFIFLSIVFVLIVMRIFSSNNANSFAPYATQPDGTPCTSPCLFGIYPNVTLDEAIALLHQHPMTRQHEQQAIRGTDTNGEHDIQFVGPRLTIYMRISNQNRVVCNTIWFADTWYRPTTGGVFDGSSPSLGDVIKYWNEPTFADMQQRKLGRLFYNGYRRTLGVPEDRQNRLSADSPVYYIGVSDTDSCYHPDAQVQWMGFTSFNHYLDRQ